jgi:lipopolysaccharide transport system ATP-binding protein
MSRPILTIENLGKSYRLGARTKPHDSFREAIAGVVSAPFRRLRHLGHDGAPAGDETFWALKDVSFEVGRGEVVGIIGRNGAGKSTLLKILSRITEPTEGCVRLRGRVASLLEVGTGFHPDLTGRENVYLNGSILGMRKAEIDRKFDEIVAFAEIERFLDTPVKRYSSGMYVRLAFAVAAHLEPEILIIDEVLAVGDAPFQKKCLGKMQEVARGGGRTVLLVSHQMQTIQAITKSAILLDRGRILKMGRTPDVVAAYFGSSRSSYDLDVVNQNGSSEARFRSIEISTESDPNPVEIVSGESMNVRIRIEVHSDLKLANLSMAIRNSDGVNLFSHCWSDNHGFLPRIGPGNHELMLEIPTRYLRPGSYWLFLCLARNETEVVAEVPGVELPIVVAQPDSNPFLETRRWGVMYIPCLWSKRSHST